MIDFSAILGRFKRPIGLKDQLQAFKLSFCTLLAKKHVMPYLLEYTGFLYPAPDTDSAFAQGRAQGRRDVMLQILHQVNLEEADLYAMLQGRPVIKEGDFQHAR